MGSKIFLEKNSVTDDEMIRELEERIEHDDPELLTLQSRRDRLLRGKEGGKEGFNKPGLGPKQAIKKPTRKGNPGKR
jgi:hypothetical protein